MPKWIFQHESTKTIHSIWYLPMAATLLKHGSFPLQPNTLKLPVPNYPLACFLLDILTKVLNCGTVIQFSPSWISSFYSPHHHDLWTAYTHCDMYETGSDRSQLMESTSSKMKQKFDSPTDGGTSTSHTRQLNSLCNKDNTLNSNIEQRDSKVHTKISTWTQNKNKTIMAIVHIIDTVLANKVATCTGLD